MSAKQWTRREAVQQMLLGPAMIGLRSLATGLPARWLMSPPTAILDAQLAIDQVVAPSVKPQFLILSTSGLGDPLNCNVPGTYEDTNIAHPSDPSMTATNVQFGTYQGKAAAPWAALSSAAGTRTAFIHHATGTEVHNDESAVLSLMNSIRIADGAPEQLTSALARQLAPRLGTVQVSPISIGADGQTEGVIFGGSPQPLLTPQSLGYVLGKPSGPLSQLGALRNADLTRLNKYFREHATTGQRNFIDIYITSQGQVDSLSDQYLDQLGLLKDNSADNQCAAAILMAQMRISPVFTVHIPFGADNHFDPGLGNETQQTVAGVATIQRMVRSIQETPIADQITFATLNVFGRSMAIANAQGGRTHNPAHHVSVLVGPNVNPGVIGGVQRANRDYGARSIDSTSGQPADDGDIAASDSLSSTGKTIGAALGIPKETLDAIIPRGRVITAACKS
jgi:hypothetical protein